MRVIVQSETEICYGNNAISAETYQAVNFDDVGDIASVNEVLRLQLSEMTSSSQSWGIAIMKLQANLPDTIPGQNVQVILFGDVHN